MRELETNLVPFALLQKFRLKIDIVAYGLSACHSSASTDKYLRPPFEIRPSAEIDILYF